MQNVSMIAAGWVCVFVSSPFLLTVVDGAVFFADSKLGGEKVVIERPFHRLYGRDGRFAELGQLVCVLSRPGRNSCSSTTLVLALAVVVVILLLPIDGELR